MSNQTAYWKLKDWKIIPRLSLIRNGHSEFSIKPRLMKLLEFFLMNQHEVVTKEAILDYVWEDRVVTENLLTKSISELRKLLEEHFPGAVQIETIRNVGYRFQSSLDIHLVDQNGVEENPNKDISRKHPLIWPSILLGLLLFFLAFRFYSEKDTKSTEVRIERITSLKGQELSPAISPDGKNIAFLWRKNPSSRYQVYLRPLSEYNPRKLTHSLASEYSPVWSADNASVIFIRQEDSGELLLVKKSVIGDDEMNLAILSEFTACRSLMWTNDHSRLIFSAKKKANSPYALFAFDIQEATFKQLTYPEAHSYGDMHPARSRTKDQLAFIRIDDNKANPSEGATVKSTLCYLNLKNLDVTEVTMIPDDVRDLEYHKKLQLHLCWVSTELTDNQLISIDDRGQKTLLHQASGGMPGNGAMGMDDILYYELWNSNLVVNKYDLKSPIELGDTTREYLSSTVWDWGLCFATTSEQMAFLSHRSGYKEVWMAPFNEAEKARQVTEFKDFTIRAVSLSPDGQHLLILCDEKGESVLYIQQSNGQNLQKISEAGIKYNSPHWSADGQSIFYAANESGTWNIWKKELGDEGQAVIVQKGGYAVLPSRNNPQEVFYTPLNQDTIFRLDMEDKSSKALILSRGFEANNWAATKNGIYFMAWKEGGCYLHYYDFSEQKTTRVSLLNNVLPGITSLSIDKNGNAVYVAQADEVNSDLMSLHLE